MHLQRFLWTAGLLLGSLASGTAQDQGSAAEILERTSPLECLIVDIVVADLKKLGAKATSFCSSFLSIPLATSTITSRSTLPPQSIVVTGTVTPAVVVVSTTVVTTETTSTSTQTIYSPLVTTLLAKRANPPVPNPLPSVASKLLLTACSCLTIPKSTKTVTTTNSIIVKPITISTTKTLATPSSVITASSTAPNVVQTIVPAVCNPANYIDSAGADETSPQTFSIDQSLVADKTTCCIQCFNTKNCFYYRWKSVSNPNCIVYKLVTQQDPSTGVAGGRCPLGVVDGSFLTTQTFPDNEAEYGICAAEAKLS